MLDLILAHRSQVSCFKRRTAVVSLCTLSSSGLVQDHSIAYLHDEPMHGPIALLVVADLSHAMFKLEGHRLICRESSCSFLLNNTWTHLNDRAQLLSSLETKCSEQIETMSPYT